ncbi:MAG: SAM-dependent methyltransferase, partial [Clostridia bacterium]|nr:SAM-dependent methyltransferase [Clostridia bacterium]
METSNKTPELCFAELLSDAAQKKVLKKAVLSKSVEKNTVRTVITKKLISGKDMLQAEKFTSDNKALHSNIHISDVNAVAELFSSFNQINLITTAGDAELKRSKNGKVTLIGEKKLMRSLSGELSDVVLDSGNDQIKNHILSGNEAFLKLLGVSDENGRIFDRKRSKFRQINKFLEHIRDIVKHLSTEGTLYVCDLCCGKSYLSFAAYYYLSTVLNRSVEMVGVDLKEDVIDYCNGICDLLGFDGLTFVCGDITKYTPEHSPELVISLHACDTATDIVLDKAMEWNARVILSTPCCHHELNHTINCKALGFV